jgi:hypothetical protein
LPCQHLHDLRVRRDRVFAGVFGAAKPPIKKGLANDLRRSLDAHPTVKLIHLNSDGGRPAARIEQAGVGEARRIRDLIEARGLSTYTATDVSVRASLPL